MKTFLVIFSLILLIPGTCSPDDKSNDFDQVSKALIFTEQSMKEKGISLVTASKSNKYVRFRIIVESKLDKEKAKKLVNKVIALIESHIENKAKFRKDYKLVFDIKSQENEKSLYSGKRDKGSKEIWWQF